MSNVEFLRILHQCDKEIDWQTESGWLLDIYEDCIPNDSEKAFTSVITLLRKLKDEGVIGIDHLVVLIDIVKRTKSSSKWNLLRILREFENKRKDYKELLKQIGRALQESNELQRSISTCVENNVIPHKTGKQIKDFDALFKMLEDRHILGIEDLTILKTIATEVEKPDLCRLVEEFEKKRKQEEDAERRNDNLRRVGAGAASFLSRGINIGGGIGAGAALAISGETIGRVLIGAVTTHCTFHNLVGGTVLVYAWRLLRRSRNLAEFFNDLTETVLPLGNFARAFSEGSIRFTIQAENVFALDALWQSYQDKTLQTKLQKFLVTEEIEQLTGGEVRLTVDIDEDEYRNARLDLMLSGIEEMKLEEERGLKERASSDSDLLKERNLITANAKDPFPEREFLPFDRRVRVEEYLENLRETFTEITLPDSGAGTLSSATSEYEFDEGDKLEKLNQFEGSLRDVTEKWNTFEEAYGGTNPSEGRKYHGIGRVLNTIGMALGIFMKEEAERFSEVFQDLVLPKTQLMDIPEG